MFGLTLFTLASSGVPAIALSQELAQASRDSTPRPNPGVSPGISPVTPASPAAPISQGDPYTLGAGDRVRVDIFRAPQYGGEVQVLSDGTLNLPLAGTVSVNGMTIEQATAAVSSAYSPFLRRPIITLSLLARRPVEIGIAGEVSRPGSYAVNVEGGEFPTVNQLLQTAGGTLQSADVRRVQIRRPQRNGAEQVINVDLMQLLQTGDLRYDIALKDGDTVFVPPAETLDIADANLLGNASFAAENERPINITVAGEVFRPGPHTVAGTARTGEAGVPGGSGGGGVPTVTRAIQVAGGIKPLANIREVELRRPTRSGTVITQTINLWELLQTGDANQDPRLQEGDTIVVSRVTEQDAAEAAALASASFSPDSIRVNVVGEVVRPGQVELTPNSPLNQAIFQAGGFNNRARRTVTLVRLNDDGTVARNEIAFDPEQSISNENNPALRNNDVVIVGRTGLASTADTLGQVLAPLGGIFSIFQFPFNFLRIFD
ncbi:MAG: SLBB domain-containing protein [Oculatellaceae cyanobacterium Prado106]|nr:SLBB domain-containing protein [Oculatellaceae cyanobacterium Prado106]